jgi:hypothetical protein
VRGALCFFEWRDKRAVLLGEPRNQSAFRRLDEVRLPLASETEGDTALPTHGPSVQESTAPSGRSFDLTRCT